MDNDTIKQIKEGDRAAFRVLYDKYAHYAIRVATAVTKDESLAADAVQETFIRVYQHLDQYDENKPFKPWFYRILLNECRRILERSGKLVPLDQEWDNDQSLAKQDEYTFEQYGDLYQAITNLKGLYRIPLILKYLHDLSELDIAEALNIKHNTVKSRLFKARQLLRKALEQEEAKEGS
ncbi:sigma-70 family RNA polymerase sigma factor [Caldalkalibacillus salinus]|uniref:sigma-70 family RNA polymerase sigma factor n=1 Tax=Caldalkalibacillus salinus TaxID=2803787 RepID=UPI0019230366